MSPPKRTGLQLLAVTASVVILMLVAFSLLPQGRTSAQSFATLSGRVYEGTTGQEPPLSLPLAQVRVDLHCSNEDYPDLGSIIATQYTNDQGWYGLGVEVRDCKYYYIRQTNLAGYTSDGARTVDGTVMTADIIQYTAPLWNQTLTGNKFWDRLPATRTPTPTNTLRPTHTPTSTPRASPTPTRTRTPGPSPTNTATSTTGRSADLELTKRTNPPSVKPGGVVWYSAKLIQHGPSTATNVVINDLLPPGFKVVTLGSGCTATPQGTNTLVRCTIASIAPSTALWYYVVLAEAAAEACGPITNTMTVSSDTPDPNPANNSASATISVEPCPERVVRLTKTLIDPPGGVAAAGDVVTFRVRATNPGSVPVTIRLEDNFPRSKFDFISALPPPASNAADPATQLLGWPNIAIPAGGGATFDLRLRTKLPGAIATNCAQAFLLESSGNWTAGVPVCADVQVKPLPGKHAPVTKRFTVPSNHVAQLGNWISFETQWLNVGTETATEVRLRDQLAPASVSSFLPLDFGFLWPFQTGDWAKVAASFKSQDVASPAVNTATWNTKWADGSKTTQSASDYVYIVDGQVGKGLFISKQLLAPLPGASVSDTIRFRVTITNVTGTDLPALALTDTFPAPCLTFTGAGTPPTSVVPGKATWGNLGPLPLGGVRTLEVFFHADAACPAALNCAEATYQLPGDPPMHAAACAPVSIQGAKPEIVVTKHRLGPSPVFPGTLVQWEIEVANAGTAPVPVVPLHDGYQVAYFDFDSAAPMPDATDLAHGRLDWHNLGPLAPGAKHTVLLRLVARAPGLGATNCAQSYYTVGSSSFVSSDCAQVDIRSEPPSIRVFKERVVQNPAVPPVVGDLVTFRISTSNTGPAPLSTVMVRDHFDPACLEFVSAPTAGPTGFTPGVLSWVLPAPVSLAPGETRAWEAVFRITAACNPIENCVTATGEGPTGQPVHDESCTGFDAEPPRPDLSITKRLAEPQYIPGVGSLMRFEVLVRNAGNSTLQTVPLHDFYDRDCMEFAGAVPAATWANQATGEVHWDDVGPLAPGSAAVASVFLRATAVCLPATSNCSRAWWEVNGQPALDDMDCANIPIRGRGQHIYLPLIYLQRALP